jgi:hypothetical protein
MKKQKLIIHWEQITYKDATIKLEMDWIDPEDIEGIWYLLVEAMGVFLYDVRKVLQKEDIPLYNEYVQDLFEEMKKVLVTKYEDA